MGMTSYSSQKKEKASSVVREGLPQETWWDNGLSEISRLSLSLTPGDRRMRAGYKKEAGELTASKTPYLELLGSNHQPRDDNKAPVPLLARRSPPRLPAKLFLHEPSRRLEKQLPAPPASSSASHQTRSPCFSARLRANLRSLIFHRHRDPASSSPSGSTASTDNSLSFTTNASHSTPPSAPSPSTDRYGHQTPRTPTSTPSARASYAMYVKLIAEQQNSNGAQLFRSNSLDLPKRRMGHNVRIPNGRRTKDGATSPPIHQSKHGNSSPRTPEVQYKQPNPPHGGNPDGMLRYMKPSLDEKARSEEDHGANAKWREQILEQTVMSSYKPGQPKAKSSSPKLKSHFLLESDKGNHPKSRRHNIPVVEPKPINNTASPRRHNLNAEGVTLSNDKHSGITMTPIVDYQTLVNFLEENQPSGQYSPQNSCPPNKFGNRTPHSLSPIMAEATISPFHSDSSSTFSTSSLTPAPSPLMDSRVTTQQYISPASTSSTVTVTVKPESGRGKYGRKIEEEAKVFLDLIADQAEYRPEYQDNSQINRAAKGMNEGKGLETLDNTIEDGDVDSAAEETRQYASLGGLGIWISQAEFASTDSSLSGSSHHSISHTNGKRIIGW
ncbi:uncharacterized protein VTP21DRAFT_398 [Calcarisporiella thermophila]|uniref:uncharacterized protein n=1 Tax=Calcarisporiella thermophila TaxID=911321 RepID=UPI00374239A8